MMQLFSWDSEELGGVYSGTVCVMAPDVETARRLAVEAFRKQPGRFEKSDEAERVESFEHDISKEPDLDPVQLITSY